MRIAAICGAPNYNNGMMFVDRALYLLLKKNDLHHNITFYCFQPEAYNKSGFKYQGLTKNTDLASYDYILIWGDFIVSNHLLKIIEPKIAKHSNDYIYDFTAKILFSHFEKNELEKVIVYGQNIFVDKIKVFSDSKYLINIQRLFSNCGLVKMRDPLSAYKAKLLTKDFEKDFLGLDAALLNYTLEKDAIEQLRGELIQNTKKPTIGLFFARSKNFNFKKKLLSKYLKFKLNQYDFKWIPWLENKQDSKSFFKYAVGANSKTDMDLLKEILQCKIILTDTYHLSLMAWSFGVPCICFGNAAEDFTLTTNDKKKEIFFISNYIEGFYFYIENFYSDLKTGKLLEVITTDNTSICNLVKENLSNYAAQNILEIEGILNNN